MSRKKWTILSNHGRVLAYVAQHPNDTTQSIASKADLSVRAVQTILDDLEKGGYLTRRKTGRKNSYQIDPDRPMRHRLERHHRVGDVLLALGIDAIKKTQPKE